MTWYATAHSFAKSLAEKYNIDIAYVCQVIAALSPAAKWERNLVDATNMVDGYYHRGFLGCVGVTVCTYGKNKIKAINVLLGTQTLSADNGLKTFNFYNNILNPESDFYVTIDRHAFKILTNDKNKGEAKVTRRDYIKAARVYQVLAKDLGLKPCQLQAITWVQWRNEGNAKND